MYRWILQFAVMALASTLSAQSRKGMVEGRITAADTGTCLVGAYVTVAGSSVGALTDEEGRYSISSIPSGPQQLVASFIGYGTIVDSLEVAAGSLAFLDFALEPSPLPLDAVIITARGRSSRLTELAGSAGAINALDITRTNPINISDAATALPGVSLGSDMPWGSRVQIRGLSRDHIVFLIDGSRVSTTTEIAAQFGTVVAADIEQIEILKGPISVLYGTGSTGGVVNAIPCGGRFSDTPQWRLATSTAYESVARGVSSYGRVEFNAPDLYLMLSQSLRHYSSYRDGGGEEVANSQFEDFQSHLNLGLRLNSAHSLDFRYQWFEARDVGIPGAGGVFPSSAVVTYPRTRRRLAGIAWRYQPALSVWRRSELRYFLQAVDRRAEVIPNTAKYQPATAAQPLRRVRPQSIEPAADHDAMGLRWNNLLAFAGHQLVVGIEGWKKQLHSTRRRVTEIDILGPDSSTVRTVESITEDRSLPNSTYRPVGVYLEDEFRITDALTLNGGVRFDLIHTDNDETYRSYLPTTEEILWEGSDDTDVSWSAQARGTYALNPQWKTYLNLAKSFRSPGLEERYLYVDLGHTVRIGDPELDSENGFFLESGISAQTRHVLWNSQFFYNRIENLIIESPSTFEGRHALKKTNAGDALFVGFESELSVVLDRHLLGSVDVAYVRGTDEQKEQYLAAIAPLNGHLSLHYGQDQGLWCKGEMALTARQDRIAPGEAPTDGHATVELSAGYGGLRTADINHRLVMGLKNAFDAQYRDHLTTSRGFELYAPGRSLYLNWSMEL